jgi:hypothetical protein
MKITDIYKLAADDLACYATALRPEFELARHHDLIIRARKRREGRARPTNNLPAATPREELS